MLKSEAQNFLSSPAKLDGSKIRLAYLEGLRGLAALYVVFVHIYGECVYKRGGLPPLVMNTVKVIAYPQLPVAIFIVLSGYCLMLPVVLSGGGHIPGGVLSYLKRRAQRILPPYYIALVLSLLLLTFMFSLQQFTGIHWDTLSDIFQPGIMPSLGAIISHFLLLHNLQLNWVAAINGPMWSLATEWQIYFLFPALLLPIYRSFGIMSVVLVAFIIGLAPSYLWPTWKDYTVSPWFLGLFALGMTGALINFSQNSSLIWWKRNTPWGALTATLWIGLIVKVAPVPAPYGVSKLFACLVGLATASLLVYCTHCVTEGNVKRHPLILQLFETPYVIGLGKFSYSLYLTHAPVVVLVHQFLLSLHLSPPVTFLTLLVVGVPLSLLISYFFYLKFEKPFILSYRKAT